MDDVSVMTNLLYSGTLNIEAAYAFDVIRMSTGSVAEFYIEPMLSCVGDIDIMFHFSHQLAIPQGNPPPTQLPVDFCRRVRVYEIIDSEFPGYVYLVTSYVLTEITDDGNYIAMQCQRQYVGRDLARELGEKMTVHGPSVVAKNPHTPKAVRSSSVSRSMLLSDQVWCVRCLSWPPTTSRWLANTTQKLRLARLSNC